MTGDMQLVVMAMLASSQHTINFDDHVAISERLLGSEGCAAAQQMIAALLDSLHSRPGADQIPQLSACAAVAVTVLERQPAAAEAEVEQCLERLLLPLLSQLAVQAAARSSLAALPAAVGLVAAEQVQSRLARLLARTCCWRLASRLLAECLGTQPVEDGPNAGAAAAAVSDTSAAALAGAVRPLPAEQAVRLAACLVQQAVQACEAEHPFPEAASPRDSLGALLRQAATACFAAALRLLGAPDLPAAVRRAAGQLVTDCLQAARLCSGGARSDCLRQLWGACKGLMGAEGPVEQRVGLALMVQFCEELLEEGTAGGESGTLGDNGPAASDESRVGGGSGGGGGAGSARRDPALWALLQQALLDSDSLTRKRAVHVLQAAVAAPASTVAATGTAEGPAAGDGACRHGRREAAPPPPQQGPVLPQAWRSFFQLWDALDEFSIHLIREALPEMDHLHPPAPGAPGTGVAPGAQDSKGSRGTHANNSSSSRAAAAGDGMAGGSALGWGWMEVLWTRGLTHSNLQAQRLVALSFLGRDWTPASLCTLPPAFVSGCLVPALGQQHVVQRKCEGSNSSSTSSSNGSTNMFEVGAAFVGRYCAALATPRQQQELLRGLLEPLARGGCTRVFVQMCAMAAAAAAEAMAPGTADIAATPAPAPTGRTGGPEQEAVSSELMALLSAVLHSHKDIGTGLLALTLYSSLLRVATSAITITTAGQLLAAGRWLHSLPLLLLQPGGPLRGPAAQWVVEASIARLPALVAPYLHGGSGQSTSDSRGGTSSLDGRVGEKEAEAAQEEEEEAKSWQADAGGLARLLLLVEAPRQQQQQRQQAPGHSIELPAAEAAPAAAPAGVAGAALLETALEPLAATLGGLYRRAHQRHGAPRRALLLLQELLLAAKPLPGCQQQQWQQQDGEEWPHEEEEEGEQQQQVGHAQQQQQQQERSGGRGRDSELWPVQGWLVRLVRTGPVVGELCSFGQLVAACAFFPGPGPNQQQDKGEEEEAQAMLAVGCIAALLTLLLREQQQQGQEGQAEASWRAARQLADALADFLQYFIEAAANSTVAPARAAVMLGLVSDAARALAAVAATAAVPGSLNGSRSGRSSIFQHQQWGPVRQAPLPSFQKVAAALCAVLQHQAAATAADLPAGATRAAAAGATRCWRLSWFAAAGLLHLQTSLDDCGGVDPLPPELLAQLLVATVTALPEAHKRDSHSLTSQVRCLRSLLPALVRSTVGMDEAQQAELQHGQVPVLRQPALCAAVAAARVPAGPGLPVSRSPGLPVTSLAAVLTWIYQSAWAALKAVKYRRTSLLAVSVSACLQPVLFEVGTSPDDPRLPLHAPGGPIQWLLSQLFVLGVKSSRVMSLVALQLCGLLAAHPAVAPQYALWPPSTAGPAGGRGDGRSEGSLLQQLLLFGHSPEAVLATSGTPGSDGIWDAEPAAELAAILAPTDPTLAAAYAGTELAPRVAAVCLMSAWARCAGESGPKAGAAAAAAAAAWRFLFELATQDEELSRGTYGLHSQTHRRKVRVWQALCVLCPVVPPAEAEAALGPLLGALAVLDAPSVQQFQETAVLQLVARQPALLRARLLPLLLDYRAAKADSPVASLILVAAQAVVLLQPERHPQHYSRLGSWQQRGGAARQGGAEEHGEQQQPLEWADGGAGAGVPQASSSGFRVCVGEQQRQQEQQGEQLGQQQQQWGEHQLEEELQEWEGLLRDVALAIMPWTLAHPHHMRCFAGVILARLCDLWPTLLLTDATGAALRAFLSTNQDLARLRRVAGADVLTGYDLAYAASPAGVFCKGVYVLGSHEQGAEPGLEGAPRPLMEAVLDYLQGERQKLRQRMAADLAAAAEADIARGQQQQQQQQEVDSHHLQLQQQQEPEPEEGGARTSHWQRKITPLDRGLAVTDPWAAVLGTPALAAASRGSCSPGDSWVGGELAEGDAAAALREVQAGRRAAAAARQQLVVVASLVDRLPNLAGLARTCEVFRASALVLSDLSVTRLPDFSSISVTAEQWLPMLEVPESALQAWLHSQASQGFTLVGLEQTSESESLPDFQFPPKTILLLGREKEGIPASLLALLHCTVEIPQLGLIRSLNVHVSGALAVYEYTRQLAGRG